jgi:hypothetical protein
MLRARGVMPAAASVRAGPIDEVVAAFDSHLEHVAGLAIGTRRIYGRYARALLDTRFGTTVPDLRAINAEYVSEFVGSHVGRLKASARRLPATATRTFLRFLISQASSPTVWSVPSPAFANGSTRRSRAFSPPRSSLRCSPRARWQRPSVDATTQS